MEFLATPSAAASAVPIARGNLRGSYWLFATNEHGGALRGTPGSASPQPEPNATELPSSAQGRPKLIKTQSYRPPSLRPRRHAPRKTSPRRRAMDLPPSLCPRRHVPRNTSPRRRRPPRLRPRRHAEQLASARRRAPSPTGARRRELRTSPGCRPRRAEEDNSARLPHQQRVSNVQKGNEETDRVGL